MAEPAERDRLWTLMESVLSSVISCFEQEDVELPKKRYVALGETAHDCEQVTVSFRQAYAGTPGEQAELPQNCHAVRSAVLLVEVVRCIPTATGARAAGPTEASLKAFAHKLARDAWILLTAGLEAADVWGLGAIADTAVTLPQGGYQAATLNLVLAVP